MTSFIDKIKSDINELITPEGEPFEDSIDLIHHTLERALLAGTGMGKQEHHDLADLLRQVT